jgi:hypothetical protein
MSLAVLPIAWNKTAANTEPFVLLNIHVLVIDTGIQKMKKRMSALPSQRTRPGIKASGRCQAPSITPMIQAEMAALYLACKFGSA